MAAAEQGPIYIDDVTGKQLADPSKATNGGAVMLKGDAAAAWLKEHPDLALKGKAAPVEDKAVEAPAENKGRSKA